MTFFKVNDPKNRELIKEVIAKRAVIREEDRRRKMGDALEFEELRRFFKPITQQTEKIEKGIGEIPGKIANILPKPVNIYQDQPPAYSFPFAQETQVPGEKQEKKKKKKNTTELPNEVEKKEDGFSIGVLPFTIDEENESVNFSGIEFTSPKIYELLTDRKSQIKWGDLNEQEKYDFGRIVTFSNILYDDYDENF